MSRTLQSTREAFVAAIAQDTPGTDLPRFVAVLDDLIAWSAARPALLEFRADEGRKGVLSFSRVGTKIVFWSVQVTRGVGPKLEIHTPSGKPLTAEERARVMQTLNTHSRSVLVEGDRLRIGFGALKNAAAQTAVLALMEQLLSGSAVDGEPAESGRARGPAPRPPAPAPRRCTAPRA
jgi:hypothetical protein